MPTPWTMVDAAFPTFTGEEKVKEQVTKLCQYMYLLVEELKYQLSNLNERNFNSSALATLKADTTADVAATLAETTAMLALVTSEVADLNARLRSLEGLSGRMEQVETDVSWLEKRQEELGEDVETLNRMLEELLAVISPDGEGGASIGNDGQELHLLGKVYINGTLIE